MKISGLNGFVICKPYDIEESNTSIIYKKEEMCAFAKVINCPDFLGLNINSIIWYDKRLPYYEMNQNGEKYIAINKKDIIAVVSEVLE